jgi:hypothetical protein
VTLWRPRFADSRFSQLAISVGSSHCISEGRGARRSEPAILAQLEQEVVTDVVDLAVSALGRYCCKKIFGLGAKNIFRGSGAKGEY